MIGFLGRPVSQQTLRHRPQPSIPSCRRPGKSSNFTTQKQLRRLVWAQHRQLMTQQRCGRALLTDKSRFELPMADHYRRKRRNVVRRNQNTGAGSMLIIGRNGMLFPKGQSLNSWTACAVHVWRAWVGWLSVWIKFLMSIWKCYFWFWPLSCIMGSRRIHTEPKVKHF